MKILSVTFFLAISLACYAQSGPTKEETIEFILNAFTDEKTILGNDAEDAIELRPQGYNSINTQIIIKDCNCKITEQFGGGSAQNYEFSFSDLSPNQITSKTKTDEGEIHFFTYSLPLRTIYQIYAETYLGRELILEDHEEYGKRYSSQVRIMATSDEKLANRIVSALKHLTKLCGGKDGF